MPGEINKMSKSAELKSVIFAISAHGNQKYGEYPYVVHLGFVNHYVNKYKHLLSNEEEKATAVTSGWLHDTIEDCDGVNYEKIKYEFGEEVASTVQSLTNVDGIYNLAELKNNKTAFFVKLCDRLANVSFLQINYKEKAHIKYAEQFEEISNNSPEEFREMVLELGKLLKIFSDS